VSVAPAWGSSRDAKPSVAPAWGLLGADEFEPWQEEVDRWLLERAGGDGRVLVLPTAAAHEGDDVFDMWAAKGIAHYERAGVSAEVVAIKSRDDAERDEVVARLDGASMVFFSGGNPFRLAQALKGSAFCREMLRRLERGLLAYGGCSAGVAWLTEMTYDSDVDDFEAVWRPGLGYIRDTLFGPHWDIVDTWIPGARDFIVGSVGDGQVFVGIDEATAMIGDGTSWNVVGRAKVHVRRDGEWAEHAAGESFELPFRVDADAG
jgi:cyanophycinase